MTLKTLSVLTLFAAFTISPASAKSLIISDEVFVPSSKEAMMESEVDAMPVVIEEEATEVTEMEKPVELVADHDELTPMPEAEDIADVVAKDITKEDDTIASWRARSGEVLQDVLKRWGARNGETYTWSTRDTSQLHRSFSYFGSYKDAISILLEREAKEASYIQDFTENTGHVFTGVKKNY